MKILVPTKRVPDTDQKIRVKPDGSDIETDGLPYVINPFDAIALEEALRMRERLAEPVEVLAVGIGTLEYEKELRNALAMGADRAMLISCAMPLDPWNVARLLQAVVQREHPQLVLMGKQAVDDDANQAGQFLAALLDWPQATFASKVVCQGDGLLVDRETDAGIERVRMKLPAVVTTDLRLNEPRYASIPSIMKARKKPIETIPYQELGVTLEPRVEVLGFEVPPPRRAGVRLKDVDELLRRLHEEAKVI
ncbi:MAG: electron transfer flavoprotein subunit beta/FixA family protein [Verrucomicrobiota bacterium]